MREPKELADIVCGPEDEMAAKCINCGEEWHEIRCKDGLCFLGVKGKSERQRDNDLKRLLVYTVAIFFMFIAIAVIIGNFT